MHSHLLAACREPHDSRRKRFFCFVMRKMKSLIILLPTYISLACAFYVPSGFFKWCCQDSAYITDRIVGKSEGMQPTHAGKIRARSLNTETADLKTKKDKINDLVLKDMKPEDKSNLNERSFVYLKQKHRTPIINVVHGIHDNLGKSYSRGLSDYDQEFIKKPFKSYIDKFLKESTFFNHIGNELTDTKTKVTKGHAVGLNKNQGYPRMDNANEIDKSIYDKLKIVELLKAPLVRCEHKNEKYGENRNEVYHVNSKQGYQSSFGSNNEMRHDIVPYPVHPTRNSQRFPSNNHRRNNYNKPAGKETLCSHIYQSHVKDCVHKTFGKDTNDNVLRLLSKCLKDMKNI